MAEMDSAAACQFASAARTGVHRTRASDGHHRGAIDDSPSAASFK